MAEPGVKGVQLSTQFLAPSFGEDHLFYAKFRWTILHILEASAAPEVHLGVFTKHHKEQQQKNAGPRAVIISFKWHH